MRRVATALALLIALARCSQTTLAQAPVPAALDAPFAHMPPLLHVKLIGPRGMQVTFFRGGAPGQSFEVPCTIGIRPGYCVRFAITGVPDQPGVTFFPTLEVRGSLFLANKLRNAQFPAALQFSAEDFGRVRTGATLQKVVVLEKPDTAIPVATTPDEPFEIAVPGQRDPLPEARRRGQPLLVLYMGERQLTRAEIGNIPGTVLLPGEKVLAAPQGPPCVEWNCFPVIDPRAGPLSPAEFMLVPDGGDVDLPAGFDREGKLRGLDPSDTMAEYFDSRGRQRLAISNRIALCIPRFIIVKTEAGLANQVAVVGPGAMRAVNGFADTRGVQPTLTNLQRMQVEKVGTNQKASGNQQMLGTAVTGRIENLVVTGTVRGTNKLDSACPPPTPEPEDGPLHIIKWPDRFGALVGDIVTFTLKYTNTGGRPITNVIVSDSLTNRLEYVPGTSKTDREAIFTTQPNDAGSQVLRWEISGTLQPRATGIISFQVRVR